MFSDKQLVEINRSAFMTTNVVINSPELRKKTNIQQLNTTYETNVIFKFLSINYFRKQWSAQVNCSAQEHNYLLEDHYLLRSWTGNKIFM